jgi:predicted HTH domain antitoxin
MIDMKIPQKVHDSFDFIKKYEPIDENYMLQQVLLYGIRDFEQEMAIKLFSEGKITISECAKMAETSVGEIMELLAARGVRSKITIDDFEEGLSNALDIFRD